MFLPKLFKKLKSFILKIIIEFKFILYSVPEQHFEIGLLSQVIKMNKETVTFSVYRPVFWDLLQLLFELGDNERITFWIIHSFTKSLKICSLWTRAEQILAKNPNSMSKVRPFLWNCVKTVEVIPTDLTTPNLQHSPAKGNQCNSTLS